MAKILISYFSFDDVDVTYDSIARELKNNNNDVLKFNISGIIDFNGINDSNLTNEFYLKKIKEFNPDIVFSFNNSFPPNLSKILDCEIFIFDADNPNFFWNKEYLLKNIDRYKFIGMMSGSKKIYENFLGRELNQDEYLYVPPASAMKSENLQKINNISFIGTNFFPNFLDNDFINLAKIDKKLIINLHNDLRENYFYNVGDLYANKYQQHEEFFNYKRFSELQNLVDRLYVGQNRLEYLSLLTDLGLVIYGVSWNYVYCYDLKLLATINNKKILSIKDNEDVYNSSKISINISHPQAITAFSWRVTDIMASSSCLLIENKPDWHDLFGGLISEEVKDAIIYKDRFDMRSKCIRLLNDERLRLKCVDECNIAIEKNGRWANRFKLIEEFCITNLRKTNLQLVRSQNYLAHEVIKIDKHSLSDEYSCNTINLQLVNAEFEISKLDKYSFSDDYSSKIKIILEKINKKRKKFKLKNRLANILVFIILFFGQIPLLDKLIIKKSTRKFLYKIIDDNKR
jgi:hypothetical protein